MQRLPCRKYMIIKNDWPVPNMYLQCIYIYIIHTIKCLYKIAVMDDYCILK